MLVASAYGVLFVSLLLVGRIRSCGLFGGVYAVLLVAPLIVQHYQGAVQQPWRVFEMHPAFLVLAYGMTTVI